MKAEWEVAHHLTVEGIGTLYFNDETQHGDGWLFQLDPAGCSAILPVRATADDAPQDDGAIPHRRWRGGFVVTLRVELLTRTLDAPDAKAACGADLVGMLDLLGLYVNEMVRTGLVPGSPNARLIWTPSGYPARMFDRCQLLNVEAPVLDGGVTVVQFQIDTLHPFYMSEAQTETSFGNGDTLVITNAGNTDYKPVVRAYGSFGDGFTITNNTVLDLDGNPLTVVYDASLPGAVAVSSPDYAEIVFPTSQVYLNGNSANLKAGIDLRVTDLFPLVPGDNEIEVTISGADSSAEVVVLSNDAWA